MKDPMMNVAGWLCAIGALNWGLVVLGFNLVEFIDTLLGATKVVSTIVYALVGISGLVMILGMLNILKMK